MWTSRLFCCAWTGKTDLILHYFRNLPFQTFHLLSAFFTATLPHPASVVQDNFMLLFCKILELTIIFWVCCKLWNSLYLWIKNMFLLPRCQYWVLKAKPIRNRHMIIPHLQPQKGLYCEPANCWFSFPYKIFASCLWSGQLCYLSVWQAVQGTRSKQELNWLQ